MRISSILSACALSAFYYADFKLALLKACKYGNASGVNFLWRRNARLPSKYGTRTKVRLVPTVLKNSQAPLCQPITGVSVPGEAQHPVC